MIKGNSGTTLTDAVCIHHNVEPREPGKRTPTPVGVNPDFSEALMGFSPSWTVPDSEH